MADSVRGRRRRYILVIMALTALTLATLSERNGDSGPIGAAGRVAHRVVQPITDAADSVFSPIHDWWHGLWHHGDIVAENRRLRRELQQALARTDDQNNAINQLQKYELFFNQTYWRNYKSVGATVVDDSPGNYESTVTINRGSEAGIRPNMAVVGARGLIGMIVQTWSGGSKVMLINDPNFGVAARTLDGRAAEGQTDGSGVLRLTFQGNGQPKHLEPRIQLHDEIVTCGTGCAGSSFPPGIPIGFVSDVSVSFDASSVHVAVTPTLDRSSLEEVKVILWTPGSAVPQSVTSALASHVPTNPHSTTTTTGAGNTTTTTTTKAGG